MISENNIVFDYTSDTKEEVLQEVSKILFKNGYIDDEIGVYEGFLDREKEGTTGFGDCIAIPHCKSIHVKQAAIVIIRLTSGIDWQSLDDSLVNYVIALAIPEQQAGTLHLELLGSLASNLMEESFVDQLLHINEKKALSAFLKDNI